MKKSTKIKRYASKPHTFKNDLQKKDTNAWLILGFALIIIAIVADLLYVAGILVLAYVLYLWWKSSKSKSSKKTIKKSKQ